MKNNNFKKKIQEQIYLDERPTIQIFNGDINTICQNIKNIELEAKQKGYHDISIRCDYYYEGSDECGEVVFVIDVYGKRFETDAQLAKRLVREEKAKISAEKRRIKKQKQIEKAEIKKLEEERKLYEKLKKKYDENSSL